LATKQVVDSSSGVESIAEEALEVDSHPDLPRRNNFDNLLKIKLDYDW
jgi:hypothetical protein